MARKQIRVGRSKDREKREKFFDFLGEIIAVLTVLSYVAIIVDANWAFIPHGVIYTIVSGIKTYGLIILLGVVGLEFCSKRNIVFRIVFLILYAAIIVFQFFPGTWETVTTTINR